MRTVSRSLAIIVSIGAQASVALPAHASEREALHKLVKPFRTTFQQGVILANKAIDSAGRHARRGIRFAGRHKGALVTLGLTAAAATALAVSPAARDTVHQAWTWLNEPVSHLQLAIQSHRIPIKIPRWFNIGAAATVGSTVLLTGGATASIAVSEAKLWIQRRRYRRKQ